MKQPQISNQVYLRHDEAAKAYYLFCLDSGKHYRLNETGYEILKLLQQGRQQSDIANWMAENYNVSIKRCLQDIEELLVFLSEHGMLDKSGGG